MIEREAQGLASDWAERALLRLAAILWDIVKAQANNITPRGAATGGIAVQSSNNLPDASLSQ
jgi:hypothetical protein